ncbi:hypothetical protein IE53DRAFT_338631 [Violaceomyces palustris]|uniref:Uncharacterized protein n=1 Tax=Violaceomyces palustris TaxID=1673888 RepID=A0ACD0P662_9BASI|nr:hypothetical protein IE53DRAFT_338631 [Violaceomyces palustris]
MPPPQRASVNLSPERPPSSQAWNQLDYSSLTPLHDPNQFARSAVSESLTKAFFYDVVLEGNSSSQENDTSASVLPWLGNVVVDQSGLTEEMMDESGLPRSSSGSSINPISPSERGDREFQPSTKTNTTTTSSSRSNPDDSAKLQSRIQELIETERSYVRRIDALHQRYAIPLRRLARDKDTAIIPLYESQRLFGNIGEIVGANQAFLFELEALVAKGAEAVRNGLGDVVYKHMACFSCYNEYFANFEKAKHIEQTMQKHKGFRDFADRTKYAMTGMGNTGLRDLLMEPVQRIPRYKLMLDGILKHMSPRDPQRARLEDSVVLASRIASCEADDKTKRAAVLWSFSRNVDSFPAGLISVHREFIDCIDVDDFPLEALGAPASALFSPAGSISSSSKTLHCTLFLFDDRLAIVKRANPTSSGRKLVGLDDLNKLADQMKTFTERSSSSTPSIGKRIELGFRGMVGLMEVEALDLGGSDFQLSFSRPPSHASGDRWVSRPVRQYITSETSGGPSSSSNDSDMLVRMEKTRFLESLWRAKALFKTREARSHVRCQVLPAVRPCSQKESGSELSWPAREAQARRIVYWNVYSRRSFLSEPSKNPIALHLNVGGEADPLPFGPESSPPHASLEILSVDETYGECQYVTNSKFRTQPTQPSRLLLTEVSARLLELSNEFSRSMGQHHPFQLVRSASPSPSPHPSTPSGRGKVAAGLENFGRNLLFGTPGSIRSGGGGGASNDFLGSPARRARSNASKSTTTNSDTYSSSGASHALTYSTMGTSVSSRAGGQRNSVFVMGSTRREAGSPPPDQTPLTGSSSPRKLIKKKRASSVGPPQPEQEQLGDRGSYLLSPESSSWGGGGGGRGGGSTSGSSEVEGEGTSPRWTASQGAARASYGTRGHARAQSTPLRMGEDEVEDGQDQDRRRRERGFVGVVNGLNRRPSGPRNPPTKSSTTSREGKGSLSPMMVRRKPILDQEVSRRGREEEGEVGGRMLQNRERTTSPIPPTTPTGTIGQASGRRVTSGSKRTLPSDATPTSKPNKRATRKEEDEVEEKEGFKRAVVGSNHPHHQQKEKKSVVSNLQGQVQGGTIEGGRRSPSEGEEEEEEEEEERRRVMGLITEFERGSDQMGDLTKQLEVEVKQLRKSLLLLLPPPQARRSTGQEEAREEMSKTFLPSPMRERSHNHQIDQQEGIRLEQRLNKIDRILQNLQERLTRWSVSSSTSRNSSERTPPTEERDRQEEIQKLKQEIRSLEPLKTQLRSLKRKCELLTTLEIDGRMENTELHKAFNEELDLMYEDTQRPENEEILSLRERVKKAKAEANRLEVQNHTLKRDLELEKAQSQVYRKILEEHGLI